MTPRASSHGGPRDGDCDAVHRALALLGRAWAGAVLWSMLDGAERFTEVRAAVPGISDAVLTARLRELCDHGLVERQVTPGPPVAVRYLLTDAGRGTREVLEALRDFARQHPVELERPAHGTAGDRAPTTLGT